MRRSAPENAIPFDLDAPARSDGTVIPFARYGAFLNSDLAHLKGEGVISLLATLYCRSCETRGAGEEDKLAQCGEKWENEAREAVQYHRALDTGPVLSKFPDESLMPPHDGKS